VHFPLRNNIYFAAIYGGKSSASFSAGKTPFILCRQPKCRLPVHLIFRLPRRQGLCFCFPQGWPAAYSLPQGTGGTLSTTVRHIFDIGERQYTAYILSAAAVLQGGAFLQYIL
jgi:hypothetical protein